MIAVVDASVIVDHITRVVDLEARLSQYDLHAPVTVDAEVLHGLRRQWFGGLLAEGEAVLAIRLFRTLQITRHPVHHLVERMWAIRQNISAYDAGYVALAEALNVPLLTRDGRLSRSSGHAARIEYID